MNPNDGRFDKKGSRDPTVVPYLKMTPDIDTWVNSLQVHIWYLYLYSSGRRNYLHHKIVTFFYHQQKIGVHITFDSPISADIRNSEAASGSKEPWSTKEKSGAIGCGGWHLQQWRCLRFGERSRFFFEFFLAVFCLTMRSRWDLFSFCLIVK